MTKKKKPEGAAWDEFVESWYMFDHQWKVDLATKYGVTYETAKHWISESGSTRKQVKAEPKMTITIPELLAMRPSVNLDFVMFDLETSGFVADWDILMTACIKPYGQETIVFRADSYPTWEKGRANDKQITVDIADELRKHAIVVGHYSKKFDVRFLRAKMFRHGLEPLPLMFGIDTWRIAKDNFKVQSRRRHSLSVFAQLDPERDEPEGDRWMRAAFNGDRDAMEKIVQHNIQCVTELEKLACISYPYLKSIPKL